MKRLTKALIASSSLLILGAFSAQAAVVDPLATDLTPGSTYSNPDDLGNSGNEEILWAQDILNDPTVTTYDTGYTDANQGLWQNMGGMVYQLDLNPFADAFGGYPEYFFIKIGVSPNNNDHFMFENSSDPMYAVIDFGQAAFTSLSQSFNLGRISHIGLINPSPVPVPAAIWLFGSAIAGFSLFVRRRKYTA